MIRTAAIWLAATAFSAAQVSAETRPATPYVAIRFNDVTAAAGLAEPLAGILGHGGAWGDYDGDGRPDIYVGGFCDRPDAEYKPADGPVANRLLRNLGDGRFQRVAAEPMEIYGRTSGSLFADLDNDGDLDLYIANNAKARPRDSAKKPATDSIQSRAKHLQSRLYRNDGGNYVDVSRTCGACPDPLHTARNVGLLDYNSDGLLDLFVVEDRFTTKPRSVLLKNLGGLKFQDVTREAGLPDGIFGLGLAIADINDDGRPDIFVGHGNRCFLSGPRQHLPRAAIARQDVCLATARQ